MDIVEVTDSKQLEDLAVSFAEDVLRRRKWGSLDTVSLCGYSPGVLSLIKTRMESYFEKKGATIEVRLGSGGYNIDVGYLLRSKPKKPVVSRFGF